jgi:Bacterial regulatory proteins, luxR family
MRNAADGGRQLLEDARSLEEVAGLAPQLAYEALQAGAPAAPELERLAARSESRLVTAYARHGSAKAARDGCSARRGGGVCGDRRAAVRRRGRKRRRDRIPIGGTTGLSNAEIADRLVLSVRTVETRLYRGMQKLGIDDRRDL